MSMSVPFNINLHIQLEGGMVVPDDDPTLAIRAGAPAYLEGG
jgi:hypothetical protein